MKLIEHNNTGSHSRIYDVEGTPHIVFQDWATGWYRVQLREEVDPVIHRGRTFRKFKEISQSEWLKSYEELEAFVTELESIPCWEACMFFIILHRKVRKDGTIDLEAICNCPTRKDEYGYFKPILEYKEECEHGVHINQRSNNSIHRFDDFTKYCFEHADNILIVQHGEVKTLDESDDPIAQTTRLWHGMNFQEKIPSTAVEKGIAVFHIGLDIWTDSETEEVIPEDSLRYYFDRAEQSIY